MAVPVYLPGIPWLLEVYPEGGALVVSWLLQAACQDVLTRSANPSWFVLRIRELCGSGPVSYRWTARPDVTLEYLGLAGYRPSWEAPLIVVVVVVAVVICLMMFVALVNHRRLLVLLRARLPGKVRVCWL